MFKLKKKKNIVGKGENAGYQHFLLFTQCFQKASFFNPFQNKPWFLCVCSISLWKTLGKGEIARNKQFLLFPQCFLPVWRTFCHFYLI